MSITTIKQLEVSSIFDIQIEKLVRYSIFEIQIEKLVRYSIFEIQFSYSYCKCFMLLCSKPFLGIQKITAYHVFNIITDF